MENNFLTDAELAATVADIKAVRRDMDILPLNVQNFAQNFGQSLVVNGAGEIGALSGWINAKTETYEDGKRVIEALTMDLATYVASKFLVNKNRLYSIEMRAILPVNANFFFQTFDINGIGANNGLTTGAYSWCYPNFSPTLDGSQYKNYTGYFGAVGNSQTSFGANVSMARMVFISTVAVPIKISAMVVKEVPLGTPVPYNLPCLPKGQMVVDPTTSEIGYFNGTSIVWFAA